MQEIVTAKALPRPAQMYSVEMSQEVAETLAIVCRRIGGSPDVSRRGHTDRILSALLRSGAIDSEDDSDQDTGLQKGQINSIFFNNFPAAK